MSAPAPFRRPSPADMPRHPVPHPAARPAASPTGFTARPASAPARSGAGGAQAAIAPGVLNRDEMFRSLYRRGIFLSGMTPEARLLAHTLVWYANHLNGHISPNQQPSADQLAKDTGLSPERIKVLLEVMWQRGWLQRRPILQGPRKGRHRTALTIPALYLERVREARAEARAKST